MTFLEKEQVLFLRKRAERNRGFGTEERSRALAWSESERPGLPKDDGSPFSEVDLPPHLRALLRPGGKERYVGPCVILPRNGLFASTELTGGARSCGETRSRSGESFSRSEVPLREASGKRSPLSRK